MGMRLIIKERKKLREVEEAEDTSEFGGTFNYIAEIEPIAFLKLTTPKEEGKFYEKFLKSIKGEKNLNNVKEKFLSINPDLDNTAHNVADRAITNLLKVGDYDENLAGNSSLSIKIFPNPWVESHEGRARIFMRMIADALKGKTTKLVKIDLITYKNSWENLQIYRKEQFKLSGHEIAAWIGGQKLPEGARGESQKTTSIKEVKRISAHLEPKTTA